MNFAKKLINKLPKNLKSKKTIFAILIVLSGFYFLSRGSADLKKIETVKVLSEDIRQEVLASGKISADKESTIHSAVSGNVVWVGVKSGDYVARGKAIVTLDRERYEIALRGAQQDVIVADAELVKVYDDIGKGDSVETFDERIKRTAAEAKKNKAFDAVKLAERNLKDTTIVSPIAGTVVELSVNAGDEILPTQEIAVVSQTGNIKFVAEVDEVDVVKVKKGQQVLLTLDAYEGRTFDSKVSEIGQRSITTSTGATAYEVDINLSEQQDFLLGMNGEANILISAVSDVLVVPTDAVVDDKFVYVKAQDLFEKKQIEPGIASDQDVEVKSGLLPGDEIVVSGFDEIGKLSLLQRIFAKLK